MAGEDDGVYVVFYVSGHGLGHVTRCAEVARALLKSSGPSTRAVTFVTSAANCAVLGSRQLKENGVIWSQRGVSHMLQLSDDGAQVTIRDRQLDAGATQQDAFCIDVNVTRDEAMALHRNIDTMIEEEVEWLQKVKPDVVVSDVVGLALPAARRAGVPSVIMSNFSWGYIYRPFIRGHEDAFRDVVVREEEMLGAADVFLRLQGWSACNPASLQSRAVDVPLIVRPQREGRKEMRARHGIEVEAKVCLLMVGGHSLGVDFDWSKIHFGADGPWVCFVTGSVLGGACVDNLPPNVRVVPSNAYIPDFVGMSDVVIGKIGYGTVCECLSSGTPLIFVPRENFSEEGDIRALLDKHRAGLEMSREVFLSGQWSDALDTALRMRSGVVAADTSGAEIAGQAIVYVAEMDRNMRKPSKRVPREGIQRLYADMVREVLAGRFVRGQSISISRAPARLDVLGGIADYSGSHVLEMPLGLSAFCATQCVRKRERVVTNNTPIDGGAKSDIIVSISSSSVDDDRSSYCEVSLCDILDVDHETGFATSKDLRVVHDVFTGFPPKDRWVSYIIGAFAVLARRVSEPLCMQNVESVHILISANNLPEGAGISSSAAVEVSSMCSIGEAFGLRFEDEMEVPILAQQVENYVVGACCGIMDQATSFLGRSNELISLKCVEPCMVLPSVTIPPNLAVVGVHTGVKRSTQSNAYARCRVGAFMGRALMRHFPETYPDVESLPFSMTGDEFLALRVDHEDPATTVEPRETYNPRAAASHPHYENKRVLKAVEIMRGTYGGPLESVDARALGQLLCESHEGYSRCSLGCPEADELVRLCKQHQAFIYGCRISGGGEGGTACMLVDAGPGGRMAVEEVMQEYSNRTGRVPTLFDGSSDGAAAFGRVSFLLS